VERERISKVLHDEVGQVVSAAGLQLELLRMDFESRVPEIAARVVAIQQSLDSALAPLRRLTSELAAVPRPGSGSQTGGESG
jgi:signal transduction histidine kinase